MICHPLPNRLVKIYLNETGLERTDYFYLHLRLGQMGLSIAKDVASSFYSLIFPSFLNGDSWGFLEFRVSILSFYLYFFWDFSLD